MTGEAIDMNYPLPGMDPDLEHPVLWEGVHARLIAAVADQLQPGLDPRYIASIEERVFIEGPQRRVPDAWIHRIEDSPEGTARDAGGSDAAVIVEADDLEIREGRVEILDCCDEMRLVALLEVVSPRLAAFRAARPELFPG